MLERVIKSRVQEQFYENNRGYYEKVSLDTAKKRGVSMNGEYLVLWHTTSKKNHENIFKQGKFNTGTFFADSDDGARFWGKHNIGEGRYVLMQCLVHPAGVLPHGEYWVANGDLELKNHHFWHPKSVEEAIKVLTENNLKEVRITMGDIPKNFSVIVDESGTKIELKVYDFEAEKLLGTIDIVQDRSGNYEVQGIAAISGFGATMYEIAMMYIHPKGLMPDRTGNTTPEAYGVWEKFFKRNDVRKRENPDWKNLSNSSNINFLANIIYSMPPSQVFKSLSFIKPNEEDMLKVRKKGSSFFNKMRRERGYNN